MQINGNPANAQARIQFIPSYHCPSEPMPAINVVAGIIQAASTNYLQNLGSQAYVNPTSATKKFAGPFYRNSSTRISQFTDGTSNTALFSEIRKGPNGSSSFQDPPVGSAIYYDVATNYSSLNDTTPLADLLDQNPASCDIPGNAWAYRGLQYYRGLIVAVYYTHTLTPNAKRRDCVQVDYGGHAATRSHHVGGSSTVLGDGSVRFVSDNIDLNTWKAIGTPNGGEVVGEF